MVGIRGGERDPVASGAVALVRGKPPFNGQRGRETERTCRIVERRELGAPRRRRRGGGGGVVFTRHGCWWCLCCCCCFCSCPGTVLLVYCCPIERTGDGPAGFRSTRAPRSFSARTVRAALSDFFLFPIPARSNVHASTAPATRARAARPFVAVVLVFRPLAVDVAVCGYARGYPCGFVRMLRH